MPEPGFLLHDTPAESEALKEARSRNNWGLEIAVAPPEGAEAHQIHAGTLAGLLAHLQILVKHAYGAVLREAGTRREADRPDAHLLNVVIPAAVGSFRLVLEAATAPDIFGHSPLAPALERIDRLFEQVDDPKQTLAMARRVGGRLPSPAALSGGEQHRPALRLGRGRRFQPEALCLVKGGGGCLGGAPFRRPNIGAESLVLVGLLDKADNGKGD